MISKSLLYGECIFLVVMVLAIVAQRFQLLPFKLAFGSFALSVVMSALAAVIALIVTGLSYGILPTELRSQAILAFILGIVPLVAIIGVVGKGLKVPKIHDISTNTEETLIFEHAHTLRSATENSVTPPSEKVLAMQKAHYTDLVPLLVELEPQQAYDRALQVAQSLGWTIEHRNDEKLQFEATESTVLFRFVDDLVVRVALEDAQTRIDMRSVSRVGVSDLGANAARIGRFQAAYTAAGN